MDDSISRIVDELVKSYFSDESATHHLNRQPLPSQEQVTEAIGVMQELMFPGFYGAQGLSGEQLRLRVLTLLARLHEILTEQIRRACAHSLGIDEPCQTPAEEAAEISEKFLTTLPEIRAVLTTDVDAAYEGDPIASCKDEIISSYPSIYAVTTYRLAHELYKLNVPLIPRIMTEHAHQRTGIDIHPATRIGKAFFIDHGTGVVIGGTAVIGNRVKLYQGVTLGAFSFPKDEAGNLIRDTKRHPTIEDDVVIYSGATILGGDTVIGKGSVIGGNVWLTKSVAPGTRVALDPPKLKIITPGSNDLRFVDDYVI
jgi:serine O-acetyltransferase